MQTIRRNIVNWGNFPVQEQLQVCRDMDFNDATQVQLFEISLRIFQNIVYKMYDARLFQNLI